MSDKHPYAVAQGPLVQVLSHFRRSFPTSTTADTLKKLGFAAQNESRILNILRFLGLIDESGDKTSAASRVFSLEDPEFAEEFGKLLAEAYKDLFDLHADEAWSLGQEKLVKFFRTADNTTALVAKHQASTFRTLAGFSGHGEIPEPRSAKATKAPKGTRAETPAARRNGATQHSDSGTRTRALGLTIRIEVNLPADGDQDTYDRIFRSLREQILNA